MQITLTPIRHDTPLTAARKGDVLVLNGTSCNLAKGQTCDWIVGTPEKVDGVWQVTLILPHGARAPEDTLFPAPIGMAKDGPVPLPPYDAPETVDDAPEPDPEGDPQPPA